MRKQLEDLRGIMEKESIDACLIPTADFHGSEYVNEYFKSREFMSGFTGSAGTLVVVGIYNIKIDRCIALNFCKADIKICRNKALLRRANLCFQPVE